MSYTMSIILLQRVSESAANVRAITMLRRPYAFWTKYMHSKRVHIINNTITVSLLEYRNQPQRYRRSP